MSVAKAFRCLLFVPGERPERFAKALAAGPDMICIDLEDAVLFDNKRQARKDMLAFLAAADTDLSRVAVRINPVTSELGDEDLAALVAARRRPAMVMLPKIKHSDDALMVAEALGEQVSLIGLVECPEALLNVDEIADGGGDALTHIMFGGADFSVELGADMGWDSLLYARGHLATVAAKHGKGLIDVPYLGVGDPAGLEDETRRVKGMGFSAKAAIHPAQVPSIQSVFASTADEIERARKIIDAFEQAGTTGALLVDGRLVDKPVITAAKKILGTAA